MYFFFAYKNYNRKATMLIVKTFLFKIFLAIFGFLIKKL